jgi:hypothetical protein
MPIVPSIHLNGSNPEDLVNLRLDAYRALHAAQDAICAMAPHERDYYPEPELFGRAYMQHYQRLQALSLIMSDLVAEAEAIQSNKGN